MRILVLSLVLIAGPLAPAPRAARGAERSERDDPAAVRRSLCRDAWSHVVRIGRVAVEQRVLVFFEDGRVEVSLFDDTGRHQADGSWSLGEADGALELELSGALMGAQGLFTISIDSTDDTLALRDRRGGRARIYDRVKGFRRPAAAAPSSP